MRVMDSIEIEKLIMLAVNNNLSLLEVGNVKIIPGPRQTQPEKLELIKQAERRMDRPLTAREMEDEVLFGPGGSIRPDDE